MSRKPSAYLERAASLIDAPSDGALALAPRAALRRDIVALYLAATDAIRTEVVDREDGGRLEGFSCCVPIGLAEGGGTNHLGLLRIRLLLGDPGFDLSAYVVSAPEQDRDARHGLLHAILRTDFDSGRTSDALATYLRASDFFASVCHADQGKVLQHLPDGGGFLPTSLFIPQGDLGCSWRRMGSGDWAFPSIGEALASAINTRAAPLHEALQSRVIGARDGLGLADAVALQAMSTTTLVYLQSAPDRVSQRNRLQAVASYPGMCWDDAYLSSNDDPLYAWSPLLGAAGEVLERIERGAAQPLAPLAKPLCAPAGFIERLARDDSGVGSELLGENPGYLDGVAQIQAHILFDPSLDDAGRTALLRFVSSVIDDATPSDDGDGEFDQPLIECPYSASLLPPRTPGTLLDRPWGEIDRLSRRLLGLPAEEGYTAYVRDYWDALNIIVDRLPPVRPDHPEGPPSPISLTGWMKRARAFHTRLRVAQRDVVAQWSGTETVASEWPRLAAEAAYDLREGGACVRIEEITDPLSLAEEGIRMNHCVGSFAAACYAGRYRVFRVSGPGDECSTLGVNLRGHPVKIDQHFGDGNSAVSAPSAALARRFVANLCREEGFAARHTLVRRGMEAPRDLPQLGLHDMMGAPVEELLSRFGSTIPPRLREALVQYETELAGLPPRADRFICEPLDVEAVEPDFVPF
ncbi:hypothetical protein J2T57_001572 [Natronocella acetinitrilica]|uniref:Uncharacterized protein n=1 Tax=Natronocella acetinitrilica TaxID=414046 RepID=A0AAE3G283_9GAMM|nr:hypothetical protein [Natronocella acetinitrilica]MCP1674470.1 hypothetical protein [Natronocella acetinitrilica]